jgi:hypothetical protein
MRKEMKNKIVAFVGYQRFKCIGEEVAYTEDHRRIRLLIMQSYCPDCGKQFVQRRTKRALKDSHFWCRRCDDCIEQRVCVPATRLKIFSM